MLTNPRQVYALADYTVERRPNGWYFSRTSRFGEKSEMKGPYGSVASISLMIARQQRNEITKRDAPNKTSE
jgi:hypothetical protein